MNEEFKLLEKQMLQLRKKLKKDYNIEYISSFIIVDNNIKLIDTNLNFEINLKNIDLETTQLRVGKNKYLDESKEKMIKARFSIPFEIEDKNLILILEDGNEKKFDDIFKDILDLIENIS